MGGEVGVVELVADTVLAGTVAHQGDLEGGEGLAGWVGEGVCLEGVGRLEGAFRRRRGLVPELGGGGERVGGS